MELDGATQDRLQGFIAVAAGATDCTITELHRLRGGAVQENWYLDADIGGGSFAGRLEAVVRTDAPSKIEISLNRAEEFSLLQAAFDAGVTVPEALWLCRDASVLGKDFFVMRRVAGDAAGHRLVKDKRLRHKGEALVERLGEELARIHTIVPSADGLGFLSVPEPSPPLYWIDWFRRCLDRLAAPHPVLEWGLRWLERNAPSKADIVLCHHDFRTGNYMVDESELTGILDWEFAGWSDFHEDIGWFCAKCWRFGANDREAAGIGARNTFYRAYHRASGRHIDTRTVSYWEVMAHVRWAVIALQQAQRHLSGSEPNLEAALTSHIVPGLELEILQLTGKES
ncbi:phosphotransferase family protein [Alphaproteobacteria bacterium]|nr:phosphotransferase family protein [Alphaproteobacteria bacterium]